MLLGTFKQTILKSHKILRKPTANQFFKLSLILNTMKYFSGKIFLKMT